MADDTSGMDDILKEAKEAFDLCVEREAQDRADAIDDIRFGRLEEQWPPEVKKRRDLDGRPCLTFNKLAAFRRQVVNDARQNRPSIKVHPADDQADPQVAEIYNGLIRNIENISDADTAYDTALEAAVDGGRGYFRIGTRFASDDSFDLDLTIDTVTNPFSIWGDPHSVAHDSAEWNVAFVVDMMKTDRFKSRYKGADTADWDGIGYNSLAAPWSDDDRIMVAEYWTREEVPRTILALSNGEIVGADVFTKQQALFAALGVAVSGERVVPSHKVTQRVMSGCEVLETNEWGGKYIPIVPVYGDVVHLEGKRYLRSLIRSAKDSQRDFNYQRTTYIEKVALAPRVPFIGPKGAFKTDADKWAAANTDNHAYIEYDGPTAPVRQEMSAVAAGEMQGMLQASDDMKTILGLYDASMGSQRQSAADQSGRAILALQRRGDTSTFHFIDNLSRAIRHAGRILIDLIPKVYSGARILRTMGPDGVPAIIPVNQPVMQAPQAPGAPPPQPGAPPKWVPQPQAQPGIGAPTAPSPTPGQEPSANDGQDQALTAMFDLSAGKYDLVVEAGPSFATKREEAASQMIALAQADPAILPIIGDILVKNLDWPGADEIVKRIQDQRQAAQQGGGMNAEAMEAQAEGQANIAKINAEAQAKQQALQQEGQLRQRQMQQAHELAVQLQAHQAEADKAKLEGQLALKQRESYAMMALKRQEAEAELALARWTAEESMKLKTIEAAHRAAQTVETPITTIGGGIG